MIEGLKRLKIFQVYNLLKMEVCLFWASEASGHLGGVGVLCVRSDLL